MRQGRPRPTTNAVAYARWRGSGFSIAREAADSSSPGPFSPAPGASCQVPVSQSGVARRHGTGVGTNSAMAPATVAGLSTGTHVLAAGTETILARGKSD